jgi:nicotinamide mononucleotide (NMN) deamidase PncC
MHSDLIKLFEVLQRSNLKLAFITAGGGAGLYDLFKIPGCSRVITEARMLYDASSFEKFLGDTVSGKFVCQAMADQLCNTLGTESKADLTLALTCALVSDRPRRSQDQGYLSLGLDQSIVLRSHISITGNTREEQDCFVTEAVLRGVYEHLEQNQ